MSRSWIALAVGAMMLSAPAGASAVNFPFEKGAGIGSKAVGAICFPYRPLRWNRSFHPDAEEMASLVSTAFGARAPHVSGTLRSIRMRLCQPHSGPLAKLVGDPAALKGSIALEVVWSGGWTGACTPQTVASLYELPQDFADRPAIAVLKALERNAGEAARLLDSADCAPSVTSPAPAAKAHLQPR